MQIVVKESSTETATAPQSQSKQKRKKSSKKMMQLVIEDVEQKRQNDAENLHVEEDQRHLNDLRRADNQFFDEIENDASAIRRGSRKTFDNLIPTFPNFPSLTSSEKRATSYSRISFAKPGNFNFESHGNEAHITFIGIELAITSEPYVKSHKGQLLKSYTICNKNIFLSFLP